VVAFLAITYARAIAAPLNAAYKAEEHAFYLEDSSSMLLLLPAAGLPAAQKAAAPLGVPVALVQVALGPAGGLGGGTAWQTRACVRACVRARKSGVTCLNEA